jgi:hypothetical protein
MESILIMKCLNEGYHEMKKKLGIPLMIIFLLFTTSYFLDEPLRVNTENKINHNLKGYVVHLQKLHLQLIGFSLTLKGLSVIQQAHPNLPVVEFPMIKASIHWREILSGKIVAELLLEKPKININLQQLRSEVESKVALKEQGWQQALENIYPLKINLLIINNAMITYVDQVSFPPLVLNHLSLKATNIRNIHTQDHIYPSSFHLETEIFSTGKGVINGKANFLAVPSPSFKASFILEKIPIDYFTSIISRENFSLHGGELLTTGDVEYAPAVKIAHIKSLMIRGMEIDYVHMESTAGAEKTRLVNVKKTANKLSNKPGILISADQISLKECTLGMVNKTATKPYRVFLSDVDFHLKNFSNHFSHGPAKSYLKAKFMGNGNMTASGNFRPEITGPDLDLYVKIDNTALTSMNTLLRAYGNFDVSAGDFSLVSELHLKNNNISGYIKPFFKNIKVYDKHKDKNQGIIHEAYEMMIGGVAKLLKNRPSQKVATKVNITGPVGKPETSTWQIIVELIKNAFFKTIYPNFEQEVSGVGKK